MRITEVLLRPAIGGAETLVHQLAAHWTAEGHAVSTVYVEPAGEHHQPVARVRALARAIDATEPDAVHAHSALPNLYARLASRGRWPVVTVLHSAERDFDSPVLRTAERALARWTAHVVAVSEPQRQEYLDRFGVDRPLSLVPNGIRADIVARTTPSATMRHAVAVSRLDPQKRLDLLLDGWQRAMDRYPELGGAGLAIAGRASDPGLQRDVETWAARVPTARLLGPVTDVPGLLGRSDVFIHAAEHEAHPIAPLEAACAGLPLIVTTAVARTLPADLAMVTFPAGDADGLAAAVRQMAHDYPDLARSAVERAPGVAAAFSLARCADRHLTCLMAKPRRSRPL